MEYFPINEIDVCDNYVVISYHSLSLLTKYTFEILKNYLISSFLFFYFFDQKKNSDSETLSRTTQTRL